MEHVGGDEENEPPEGDLEDRGMDVEMGQAEGKEGEVSSAEDGVLSVRFKASCVPACAISAQSELNPGLPFHPISI